ncbi:TlpA family protein disulfide reductase [Flavobacteriales bacterium]|jgi:peroxiredoxin|nr:TlpA family protein disulfide reductase [Flavobacteriales bacterium]
MKNIFFVFTAILAFNFSSVSEAQTIKGKLNIKRQTNKQVDLYRTEGKYKYKVDSTKVLTDGSFTFKYKKHLKGFYKLTLGNENNIVDVILNSSEPVVSLAFSQIRLEKGIEVIQSNENKAYWEFKKEDSSVQSKIKNLKKQRGQFKSQANEAKVNEMTNEIIKLEKELFNFVQTVINKYPTTFFSKTKIASLSKTPKDKATYFDDLDFSNESFIRSDVYATRFQDYIIKHSGHTEVGYYNAVDDIMKKSKVNEKVFEFALYNLLDGFYGSGLEDVATYIMEEYFYGEACGEIEINDLLRSKADLIKNLQIGNIPPDFTIKSNYGADVNLKNTCANNKYTVIMFWATHCPHCMRDLPGFVPVYNEYKSKGLEVIGVALDVNQTKWKNTIEEKGFNWKNVSQFGNYKSPVCIDYKINKTPSWFILDSSMKIIAKPKGKQEILRFLKNNL